MKQVFKKSTILLISLCMVVIISGCKDESKQPGFVNKYANLEKDDGWISELIIEEIIIGEKKGEKQFDFGGVNLKYKHIEGIYTPVVDKEGNVIQKIETNIPMYIHNPEVKEEVKDISKFLTAKQFSEPISKKDLTGLSLSHFSYEDIVSLVNNALEDTFKEKVFGKYNIPIHDCVQKLLKDESILQVSYSNAYGYIRVINIEFIYEDGTYLSDLVESGVANQQQIKANDSINELEISIVETQSMEFKDIVSPIEDENEFKSALEHLVIETIKEQ